MKAPALHKPHGKNRFCGPTALSILTGLSTDDCAAVVRLVNPGKRAVKGMNDWEMLDALRKLGGDGKHARGVGMRVTLKQWLDQRSDELRQVPLVVAAGHHYMVVRGELVMCSHTCKQWVHILSHPFRNKRFASAMAITPPAKARVPAEVLQLRKAQADNQRRSASARTRALALAAELRLEITNPYHDELEIWVADEAWWRQLMEPAGLLAEGETPLDAICDQDRTSAAGWPDLLEALEAIKETWIKG